MPSRCGMKSAGWRAGTLEVGKLSQRSAATPLLYQSRRPKIQDSRFHSPGAKMQKHDMEGFPDSEEEDRVHLIFKQSK
ncbi:unnamed protein product [[Candida] boidinii]|nr:unnamed protein product [[Candida] boidinii]